MHYAKGVQAHEYHIYQVVNWITERGLNKKRNECEIIGILKYIKTIVVQPPSYSGVVKLSVLSHEL